MYAINFEYDGEYLADKGFIICRVGSGDELKTIQTGAKIEMNTVSNIHGTKYFLTNSRYSECLTTTFQICKNPDLYRDLSISDIEVRKISRWLSRKEYHNFCFISEYGDCVDECYFDASFNVSKIADDNGTFAFELELLTNSPFAHGEKEVTTYNITSGSKKIIVKDKSDEIGYMYPDVKIKINANGALKITNDMTGDTLLINNCKTGEVITMSGAAHVIQTSLDAHDISSDFNFNYLRIGNTYRNRINNIEVSIPCEITLTVVPFIRNMPF